jgi:metal-responsive CopG/Arc/MetJ family transcriptional regulator
MIMSEAVMEQPRSGRGVTRVQLDLPTDRVDQLDRLVNEAGFSTRKDLFNNALALLQWAVKEARRGRAIASVDEANDRFTELNMPFLSELSHEVASKPKKP